MRYCIFCGVNIPLNASFCQTCGKQQPENTTSADETSEEEPKEGLDAILNSPKKMVIIGIGGFLAVMMILTLIMYFLFTK